MKDQLIEAAERGNAEAQFNLGIVYGNGLIDTRYVVEGNRDKAFRWLLAAAEQGLPRAQIKLAELYASEPELPEGSVKACGWYLVAADALQGAHREKALSAYQRASSRLTPAQVAEVENFAEGWAAKTPALPALSSQAEAFGETRP
jgi:TPR repeat protein